MRTSRAALLAALLAACSGDSPEGGLGTFANRGSHASLFPITGGTAHDTTDCNDCHGAFDTFAKFDCTGAGCHTDAKTTPLHAAIKDYAWRSTDCYRCHADGGVQVTNHGARFPVGSGTAHVTVACSGCHLPNQPRTAANVDCATCHAQRTPAAAHGAVTDFGPASAACLKCHADGQVDRIAAHRPFTLGKGKSTAGRHDTVCIVCHAGARADKPWGQDFKSPAVLACYASSCHDAQSVKAIGAHARFNPFPVGNGAECARCHPSGRGG